MRGSIPRGITPRDRLDRVLNLFAAEVGPQLRQDRNMQDWPIQIGHREQPLSLLMTDPDFVLDAHQCLKMIRDRGHMILSLPSAERRAGRLSRELLALRNAHAHGKDISAEDASRGSRIAEELLLMFGLSEGAAIAAELALPPSIRYVADLRTVLVEEAKKKSLITYDEVLSVLGLSDDEAGYRILFRQLNVLAAKQLILDEPQLCALVVLPDTRIPGAGFYWIVDVDRNDDDDEKRAAHAEATNKVFNHRW